MIATNGRRCQATMRRHIAPPLRDHTHAGQPLLLKVKPPRWVILFPGASFYITHRMLRSRAAALAQMNDRELRAILAHELAHDQHEHTFSARFFGGAESARTTSLMACMRASPITPEPAFAQPGQPVFDIITPAGAPEACAAERQLADMLFADQRCRAASAWGAPSRRAPPCLRRCRRCRRHLRARRWRHLPRPHPPAGGPSPGASH
jgi:hypothetical protein